MFYVQSSYGSSNVRVVTPQPSFSLQPKFIPRSFRGRYHQPSSAMRWPPWSSDAGKDNDNKKHPVAWADTLNATNWSRYTGPETVVPTVLLTATILLGVRVYRLYLRRIPEATHVQPGFFRKRSLFGTVTRVGDGDNFHLYHTPGGRLTGWGWLRTVPEKATDLRKRTVKLHCPST